MKFLVDHADVEKIKRIFEYYPMDGVSTNPSILAATGRPPFEVLTEIRKVIGDEADLHVQVVASTFDGMIADAHRIVSELGKNTFVKVPSVPEGFKVMKALHTEGIRITGTAIYTAMQGYLAAKSGATYVAPYINRIDNMGFDGLQIAKEIQDIFVKNGMDQESGLLAASFKNSQQVLELARYGIKAATIAPDVIDGLVNNAAITAAVNDFVRNFEGLVGAGKTMADC